MRLHDINKYIKESYQPILNEYNNQIPFTEKLKNELIEAVSCNSNIDDFPIIVEVIRKYYPDNEWYEVTSVDIPNELYRYDSSDVINHIVSNLKIETCDYEDKSEYDLESLNEDIVSKVANVANKVGNKIIQGTQSTLKAVNDFSNAKNQNTTTNNTSNTTKTNISNNTQNNNSQPVNIEYRSNDPIWMIQYDDGGKLVTQYSPGANANKAIANAKAGGALENNTRVKKVAKVKDRIQSADAFRKLAKEFLKDGSLTTDEFSKLKEAFNEHPGEINYKGYIIKFSRDGRAVILNKDFKIVKNDIGSEEEGREYIDSLQECANKELQKDTIKTRNGKWTNRGDNSTKHEKFDTKKEAVKETLGRDIISMLDKRSIEEIDGVRYAYDYLTQKDLAEVKDIVLKLLRKEFPNSTFEVYSITLTYDELSMGVLKDDVDFNRGISIKLNRFDYSDNLNKVLNNYTPQLAHELIDEMKATIFDMSTEESLKEDTVKKSNGKWTNRGNSGKEHGEFKTKKEADAQRKAMYANGYKESYTSNGRLDILFDIIDDSFPEVDDDILREDFITEAIRLTSIPGVKRDPSNDFSDDGNRFTAYIYKDTVPISYLKSNGDIYLTIAFHHLPDINSEEYRKFDSYKVANDFNGVSESSYNADVFAKNLELAYNDIVNFRNNIEDVDEDEIDRRIEEINKSCEEYKEKVKNYLNSRIDRIMNLTPSQFRELQGYVRNAGTRTADYIKDLNQSSKRHILSQDINDLKRNIASTWNFKYIEELIG